MSRILACFLAAAAVSAGRVGLRGKDLPPPSNLFPTIGILSVPEQTGDAPCDTSSASSGASCFTTFYMHWVQSAGARAIILPVGANASTLDALLDSVNGVLFTGGGVEDFNFTSPFMLTAGYIYQSVLAKNDGGTFMPLHGTCQGMQVLAALTARNGSVVSMYAFDSENMSIPLDITWDGHHSSRLFNADTAPGGVVGTLGGAPVTINLHHDGVRVGAFEENPALGAFYVLVSTNFDRRGQAFVSTMEGWDYPVVGTQWHPERNAYEWRAIFSPEAHSPEAVAAMQYMVTFFVTDARRNAQSFSDPALFAHYSAFSYPIVSAPDAATSGYQWLLFTG